MNDIDRNDHYDSAVGIHEISSIYVSAEEHAAGCLNADKLDTAKQIFAEKGYIRIENLFSVEQIGAFDSLYRRRNAKLLAATNKQDKRPLFTVRIEGPFSDPIILANPLLEPILTHFLGRDFIVAALSAVASFPGAPDQHLHRDATPLFGDDNMTDKDLPPYSVTMLVPLVDFTTETGCTRVWPGSHHIAGQQNGLSVGSLDPEVKVGSVLITDGRILHRGAANRSEKLRPLFYVTFHRAWYRDFWGYENRPPILVSDAEFGRMPAECKARIGWFRDRYAHLGRKHGIRRMLPTSLRLKLFKDT